MNNATDFACYCIKSLRRCDRLSVAHLQKGARAPWDLAVDTINELVAQGILIRVNDGLLEIAPGH